MGHGVRIQTNLLVRNSLRRLAHQLLHVLDSAHLGVNLTEHSRALLQAEEDIFLDECELDRRGQALELFELRVGFGEEGLLVLFASQREESAWLVAACEERSGGLGLAVG